METVRNTDIDAIHPESLSLENRAAPLSVVILTYNEEKNLEACLRSLRGLARECFVVDSGSTDGTGPIAESLGVEVVHHAFEGHARQWNWALRNLPLSFEWALCLDADQRLTPELQEEIRLVLRSPPAEVDGFYMKRRQIFLGRWIRHGAYYPKYYLKLLRHRSAWSDEREYLDFRFYVKGHVAYLRHDVIEDNRKDYDLSVWTHKHLSFVMKQSLEEFHRQNGKVRGFAIRPELLGNPDQRTLWQKCVWYRLPLYFRPFLYFAYRYFLRLGFLDGKEGFVFHFLHAFWYRLMVDTQLDRLRREAQKS